MVRVLSVWAVMLIICKPEVDVRAHSVEPIAGNFSVHVCDITPAVLGCINLGPIAETHFSHKHNHKCLRHRIERVKPYRFINIYLVDSQYNAYHI